MYMESKQTEELQTLDNEQIQALINKTEASREAVNSRIEKLDRKIGKIAVKEATIGGMIFDTSETAGARSATDSYKSPSDPKVEPILATERIITQKTSGKVTEKLSDKYSLRGPNASRIRGLGETKPSGDQLGFFERRAQIKSAERQRKQSLRQARARRAEVMAGGMLGLGETKKWGTRIDRIKGAKDLDESYKRGEISAKEVIEGKDRLLSQRQVVPVKSVRRERLRERTGSTWNYTRASRPVRTKIYSYRKKRYEGKLDSSRQSLIRLSNRQQALEEEMRQREEES